MVYCHCTVLKFVIMLNHCWTPTTASVYKRHAATWCLRVGGAYHTQLWLQLMQRSLPGAPPLVLLYQLCGCIHRSVFTVIPSQYRSYDVTSRQSQMVHGRSRIMMMVHARDEQCSREVTALYKFWTFKQTPPLFHQAYTVLAEHNDNVFLLL